ncbi:hypothetical protein PIB30_017945 [Stylosanthes scabra]|uniref:Uncharacterized protein n=1 Tax=Stylosanthes scabra TaxID=79078 RepID=A0ABU6S7N2_9FABA|nr:hypothetical protein [Stylosanthes scabra]
MPPEPHFPAVTATATALAPAPAVTASRPISQLPSPHPRYPSPQQQQQPLHSPQKQPLPIRSPAPHLSKPHEPFMCYGVGGGGGRGGGFLPKGMQQPALAYSHGVRAMAPHMEYINQALHMTNARPPQQYAHPGHPPVAKGAAASAVPAQGKGAPRFAVSDSNQYKDTSTRSE